MLGITRKIIAFSRWLILPGIVALCLFPGCARMTVPLTGISVPVPGIQMDMAPFMEIFGSYGEGNFQNRSWTDAFEAMHLKLSREYAFTEWKEIDWDDLYDRFHPLVMAAQAEQNEFAYYLALRTYLFSLPDGYITITTPKEYREAEIGGGYGFSVLPLSDGRVVVAHIEEDSFAEVAGIQWGAEIIEWNGLPIAEAIAKVSVLWSDSPPATEEYTLFEKCAMLTRAPVGTKAAIMFRNPDTESIWVTRLEARRDFFSGLEDLTRADKAFSEFESPIESAILPENIGYIKVYCNAPTLVMPFPARAFRRAVERFKQASVDGIVLDLRGNIGGLDTIAAAFAGHFTATSLFFRDVVAFDAAKGGFALYEDERLTIEPRTPHFGKPVAVLVHRSTRGGGQALAAALDALPNVVTVGALGGEGSYAYPGGQITMPRGYVLTYPTGRMLTMDGEILITSSAKKETRLEPEVRIPLTLETYDQYFRQGGDPVLTMGIAEIQRLADAQKEDSVTPEG